MACGCAGASVVGSDLRPRALMCLTCRERGDVCGVDGVSIRLRILGKECAPCPLGRHPDKDGLVLWRDCEWVGPPFIHRWLIRRRWFRRLVGGGKNLTGPMAGCGCYAPLKRWWESYTSAHKGGSHGDVSDGRTAAQAAGAGLWTGSVTKRRSVSTPNW